MTIKKKPTGLEKSSSSTEFPQSWIGVQIKILLESLNFPIPQFSQGSFSSIDNLHHDRGVAER
ncbi:MAG TPA: hypothetical protein PLL95_14380, partial [Anaerolineales bacterium]|nr:hypothetical protein [Anaerolineales bacterium]